MIMRALLGRAMRARRAGVGLGWGERLRCTRGGGDETRKEGGASFFLVACIFRYLTCRSTARLRVRAGLVVVVWCGVDGKGREGKGMDLYVSRFSVRVGCFESYGACMSHVRKE